MKKQVKLKMPGDVLFLLGATASIQLLSIGGITVFNILLVISVIAVLVWKRKYINEKWLCLAFLTSLLTLIYSQTFGGLNSNFKRSAFVAGITFLMMLLIYSRLNGSPKYAYKYIKGFDLTCKLSIGWCCFQVLFYTLFSIDLNDLVFKQILGVDGDVSSYINGNIILTGFYSHRGYMIPILLYSYFRSKKISQKALIVIVAFMTRSGAVSIGIIACICCEILYKFFQTIKENKIKQKSMIVGITTIIVALIAFIVFSKQVEEVFSNLIFRIISASMDIADNSA